MKRLNRAFIGDLLRSLSIRVGGTAISFVVLACLTRLLSLEEFGQYSFLFTVASIVVVLLPLGLPQVAIRYISEERSVEVSAFMGLALLVVLINVSLLVGLTFIGGVEIPGLGRGELLLAGALAIAMAAGRLGVQVTRARHRLVVSQSAEQVLIPILGLVLLVVAILTLGQPTATLALLCLACAHLMVAIWLIISLGPSTASTRLPVEPLAFLRRSIPLALVAATTTAGARGVIVILEALGSSQSVAVFTVALTISNLMLFAQFASNFATGPGLAAMHERGDHAVLQQRIGLAVCFSSAYALGLLTVLCLVPTLVLGLFGADYREGAEALVILALGACFNVFCGPIAPIFSALSGQNVYFAIKAVGMVLKLSLAAWLIVDFGIVGAAMATATFTVLENLVLTLYVAKRFSIHTSVFHLANVREGWREAQRLLRGLARGGVKP